MKKDLWSRPSLLREFALLAALIVFVLMMVSLWVTYETYRDQSEHIQHQLETEATRLDRAMILEIEHSSYLLDALGRQITHMNQSDLNGIAQLLRSFDTDATRHNVFSWIDENQNNVVSSNRGVHSKPIDVSDRDYVKKTISDPWKIQVGRPIEGRISEKWVLPVALGLTDNTGKYIGTILISMDIGTITRNLKDAIKDPTISFAIYSNTILPLTHSGDEAVALERYSEMLKNLDFTKRPSGVLATGSLSDERSMYVYYELSANYPYIILLGYDSKASAYAIRDMLLPRLMQIFLMGVFTLTLLWIVRLRILKPVAQLTELTAGIVRDEIHYPALPRGSASEVMALGRQITKLGDYLHEIRRIEEEKENKNLMLRKGKESAELSNKIKTEFLTAMSHELRTPLNTIVGFSEVIKKEIYGPLQNEKYGQYAKDINEAAHHLQSLIDDVLALSNAEAGLLDLQEKPVDVRFVLNKCLRLVSERLQERKLHVEIKAPDTLPRLLVDELRLKQIIINLILNAASHSIEDSHIIVEVALERDKKGGETFCISFVDFGSKNAVGGRKPGADKTGAAHARRPELSNLGVPLTKALVAMHQATLDIQSPPGRPTAVIVRFPQERIVY